MAIRSSLLSAAIIAGIAGSSTATSLIFSTSTPESVPGPGATTTTFADDDFVRWDFGTDTGTVEIEGSDINPNPTNPNAGLPDPNALFVRDNGDGNLIFSIQTGAASFPGGFNDDDLIEYDRTSGDLSTFFSFDGLITTRGDVDIDGFHLRDDGLFLLANTSDFSLGGVDFQNGDIALYDPVSGVASLYFDEGLFGGVDARVTALSLNDNGNLLLAAFNEDTGGDLTLGGLTFGRGDLVEYDANAGTASVLFPSSNFGDTADFDAAHLAAPVPQTTPVPLPAAVWMLAAGLAGLGALGRRSKKA